MLAIIGESASGKTTLQNNFVDKLNYNRLLKITTRPKRQSEIDGVDYIFTTQEKFSRRIGLGYISKETLQIYNGWQYGFSTEDFTVPRMVAILTPAELRKYKKNGYNIFSVYLKVDRRSRLIKILSRGDDIEEAYRRNLSEVGQFDGIENEVDYVIENCEYKLSEVMVFDKVVNMLGIKVKGQLNENH